MPSRDNRDFLIKLDDSTKQTFRPGDVVKGNVCFRSDYDEPVGQVKVHFSGRTKAKIYRHDGQGNRQVYRGRSVLFYQTIELYDGKFTHKAPDFSWPFEFTFPTNAQETSEGNQWIKADPNFFRSDEFEEVVLPMTFTHRGYWMKFYHSFDCLVEYKLEASLSKPDTPKQFYFEEVTHLPFVPLHALPKEPQTLVHRESIPRESIEIKTFALDPDKAGRSLSIKEKAKGILKSDSVPSSIFQIDFHSPEKVHLGEKGTVSLRLQYSAEASSYSEVPRIVLTSVNFTLISFTNVRSREGFFPSLKNCHEQKIPCDASVQDKSDEWVQPFSKATDYTKTFHLDDLAFLEVAPTFKTINVSKRYELRTEYTVECAGKSKKVQRQDPIEILHDELRDAPVLPSYAAVDEAAVNGALADESDEELPVYTEMPDSSETTALEGPAPPPPGSEKTPAASAAAES